MNVKMVYLDREYESLRQEINKAIDSVLYSSRFILGPNVAKLEDELAMYCGTNYAVCLNSGTDALEFSLTVMGAKDEKVLVPNFTFGATAEAVHSAGGIVHVGHVNRDTFQLDGDKVYSGYFPPHSIEYVVPVDLFGLCSWWNPDIDFLEDKVIIEDAAQAFGASTTFRKAGSLGDVGCFSFYPTKTLGCYGDGGAIVTNDRFIAAEISKLRNHYLSEPYFHTKVGRNSRLDEIQAAILLVKLRYIDDWIIRKREIAAKYTKAIKECLDGIVEAPVEPLGCYHSYHQYTIKTKIRGQIKRHLDANGVETQIYYPVPLNEMPPFYTKLFSMQKNCYYRNPERELCNSVLSLPIHHFMKDDEVEYVIDKLIEASI